MKSGDVEVIVVPNGPDESWRDALLPYESNKVVRVVRVKEANANIARNAGLAEARGEFVRFLDDDDYLIPEGAVRQYELIQASGVDLVSGSVQLVDSRGRCFDVWHQPDMDDLCSAVLGPWRRCQPTAHVYRRSSLGNVRWNLNTKVHQDYEWFFDLCASRELSWLKTQDVVGVYWRHRKLRISTATKYNFLRNKVLVPMLKRTYRQLLIKERLNENRRRAVAQGFWGCVHAAFFLEPNYWSEVARIAQSIDRNARPNKPIYSYPVLKHIDPLLIQWIFLPKRWVYYHIRRLLKKWQP